MARSFSASRRLSRAFSSSLVRLDASAFFSDPYWFNHRYQSRLGDLEFLDDFDERLSVVEHFLALPDFGDDLLGCVSACHDSRIFFCVHSWTRNSHKHLNSVGAPNQ